MKRSGIVIAYGAGILTAFAAIATGQAISEPRKISFDEIDVHRINVVEPDGTLRMTIAGMLFFNDEGTENGGLIFGGKSEAGHVINFGHLSFDQYEQDQVATLEQSEEDGHRVSGLTIDDRPDAALDFAGLSALEQEPDSPAKTAKLEKLEQSGAFGATRLFAGKDSTGGSLVSLKDAQGQTRLKLVVSAKGEASILFLDEHGRTVKTISAGDLH